MQPFGFSTNRALNVILYQKQKECERYGIEFQINIGFGDLSFINYSDTCAIFGNALDNAATACQEILVYKTARGISWIWSYQFKKCRFKL